jgi:non-heme chloroperoxidase
MSWGTPSGAVPAVGSSSTPKAEETRRRGRRTRFRSPALGYNSAVPPYVRQAMLSRTLVHDDQLERLTAPVLITHGLDDAVVLPSMGEHHARLIPHARTSSYEGVGHTPFREDPDRSNAELAAFASSL